MGQWVGPELTFTRMIVEVLSDQVEKALAVSREEVCILSKESQGSRNPFVLHQCSCFILVLVGKLAVNRHYYVTASVFFYY